MNSSSCRSNVQAFFVAGWLFLSMAAPAQQEVLNADSWFWRTYQHTIGKADGDRCPMSPSCSAYAEQAIRKHGWIMGWIMTFDRFCHEGTEARLAANGIRYRNGRLKAISEVEHNDFWWASASALDEASFLKQGQTELDRIQGSEDDSFRLTCLSWVRDVGSRLIDLGEGARAAPLFVALWTRQRDPADALQGALAFAEAGNMAASAALLEDLLDLLQMDNRIWGNEIRPRAKLAQGFIYRKSGLFDAAVESFDQAEQWASAKTMRQHAAAYSAVSLMEAQRWKKAALRIDNLDHPDAALIRMEIETDVEWRSPWLAGTMSAILPGSGQVYCGRYQEGIWAFVMCGVFAAATYESFNQDFEWVGAAAALTGLSWYSGNIYGAVNAAHKHNRRARAQRIRSVAERLELRPDNHALHLLMRFDW